MRESVYIFSLACIPLLCIHQQFRLSQFDFLLPKRFIHGIGVFDVGLILLL